MIEFFTSAYKDTPTFVIIIEAIVFVFGIVSVYFAKNENIWVYPTGLIATTLTVYLLYRAGYFGDMVVNGYYSIMSIYGWYMWSRKTPENTTIPISRTNYKEKLTAVGMFFLTIFVIFIVYKGYGYEIKPENYIDIITSGIFFAAMWLMALKKIENWTLWIIGDFISIPLYAYKGLGILALQYLIFTIVAIQAYIAWKKILSDRSPT